MATFKSGLEKICALNNLLLSMTIGVLRMKIDQVSYNFLLLVYLLKDAAVHKGSFSFYPSQQPFC